MRGSGKLSCGDQVSTRTSPQTCIVAVPGRLFVARRLTPRPPPCIVPRCCLHRCCGNDERSLLLFTPLVACLSPLKFKCHASVSYTHRDNTYRKFILSLKSFCDWLYCNKIILVVCSFCKKLVISQSQQTIHREHCLVFYLVKKYCTFAQIIARNRQNGFYTFFSHK